MTVPSSALSGDVTNVCRLNRADRTKVKKSARHSGLLGPNDSAGVELLRCQALERRHATSPGLAKATSNPIAITDPPHGQVVGSLAKVKAKARETSQVKHGHAIRGAGLAATTKLRTRVATRDLILKITYVNCHGFSSVIDFRFNLGILKQSRKTNEKTTNR